MRLVACSTSCSSSNAAVWNILYFPCSTFSPALASTALDPISANISLIYPNFYSHATAQNEPQTSNPARRHDRQEAGPVQADRRGGPACLGRCPAGFWPQEERGRQTRVRAFRVVLGLLHAFKVKLDKSGGRFCLPWLLSAAFNVHQMSRTCGVLL